MAAVTSPVTAHAAAARRALIDAAAARGVRCHAAGSGVLRRFARGAPAGEPIALLGPPPGAALEDVLLGRGAVWLLAGLSYPTNVGFALRTAEVSGAQGVIVDAAFSAADRRTALRASMRADRVFPVIWSDAPTSLAAARAAGARIVAVEDNGTKAPWEIDLRGPVLLVVGGERDGIPPPVLERCDDIVRVPMAGFIPSYNVQAAMAAVAVERLRQVGA